MLQVHCKIVQFFERIFRHGEVNNARIMSRNGPEASSEQRRAKKKNSDEESAKS